MGVKLKHIFIALLFIVFINNCSSINTNIETNNKENIISQYSGKHFDCLEKENKNIINDINNNTFRREVILDELGRLIVNNSENIGYTSLYSAIISNCELNTGVNNVEIEITNYASIKNQSFERSVNNFQIEGIKGSLKIKYDYENNLENIGITLKMRHNFKTNRNDMFPVILSSISVMDENGNFALFNNERINGWEIGEIDYIEKNRFIYKLINSDQLINLPLNFVIKKYVQNPSKFYQFSVIFYGQKLVIQVSPSD